MTGHPAVDVAFREALAADARAARLSPAFRVYYRFRGLIPIGVRQWLQRNRRIEAPPRWFYPDALIAALASRVKAAGGEISTVHPWPDGAQFSLVLTHDVETAEGLRRVARIADLEESLGFRSSWNIVPHKYPLDWGLIRDLQARGFEIGVHGYNHDGKLFISRSTFRRRVPAINAALADFDAVGFRAPMVQRNLDWMQSLAVEYDASYFDADPFQSMPGGVGSLWPFIAGRFVELPYTLPQDHIVFLALEQRDGKIWREKLDYIARLCGMALIITHPDYLDSNWRIDLYRELLERARDIAPMWHSLPRDVAAWWRERDQSTLEWDETGEWRIQGPAADRARPVKICIGSKASDSRSTSASTTGERPSSSDDTLRFVEFAAIPADA